MRELSASKEPDHLIKTMLRLAVPLWADKVKHYDDETFKERCKICSETVAYRGDIMLYGGPKGIAAEGFNRLAEGIAMMAIFCTGGVEAFGDRYEYDKDGKPIVSKLQKKTKKKAL